MQCLMQISPNRKNTDTFFTLPLPSLLHTHDSLGLGFAQEVHHITTVYRITYALLRCITDAEEFSKGAIVLLRAPTNFLN